MGFVDKPVGNDKKQPSPHQLLCLDVVSQALAKLYNAFGIKSYEFRIEECDKNLGIGNVLFHLNSKFIRQISLFLLIDVFKSS